jgi:hypothetical protein
MFSKLAKSQTALEKANGLSELECALLDMHMTAAFSRPDSHLRLIDYIRAKQHGVWFDIFVIEIEIALISLAISAAGKVGIIDFHFYKGLGIAPELPLA